MIRKRRLCHDSLFKSMEIKNVIELSAFSKSLSKKITYLNHEEHILIDIEQIAAITPSSDGLLTALLTGVVHQKVAIKSK